MYLNKKTYVKNWDHIKPEERHEVKVYKAGKIVLTIKPERITYIEEEIAYWRKFNALHQWFVENVQNGEDNCKSSYVGREQFQELLNVLKKVEANHELADDLLPTQPGFFFGNTEYDENYFENVSETIRIIEELLSEEEEADYYYRSSW